MSAGESSEIDIEIPAFESPIGIRRGPDRAQTKLKSDDVIHIFSKTKSQVPNIQPNSKRVNQKVAQDSTNGGTTWDVLVSVVPFYYLIVVETKLNNALYLNFFFFF
jgi:hypothetical protein